MKTKPEFRKVALDFAKKNGFDTVHFYGMLGKIDGPGADIEVYTGGYKTPCVVGLPQVILTDGKTAKFYCLDEPFKILDACTKLPKVVFEYDCMCWFGNSYNLKLLEDGRLVRLAYGYSKLGPEERIDEDKEYVLLNRPELVKEIKQLIREEREELKKIPKHISNCSICDGANETFKFGRLKIAGSNILTVAMEGYQEKYKKYNAVPMGWEEELLQFQRIFKKFEDKFHEYFEYPLFNGEWKEEEN